MKTLTQSSDYKNQGSRNLDNAFGNPWMYAATSLCITFTTVMLIFLAVGTIFAKGEALQGVLLSWQLFGACAIAVALQVVFFTHYIFKTLGYLARIALFGVVLYVILCISFMTVFSWFPVYNLGVWVSFTVIYLLIFATLSVVFTLKTRYEKQQYAQKLEAYFQKKAQAATQDTMRGTVQDTAHSTTQETAQDMTPVATHGDSEYDYDK